MTRLKGAREDPVWYLNESLKFYLELEAEATNGKRVLVPVFLHLTGG